MSGKPHKHAELIRAWADGADIEMLCFDGRWQFVSRPLWADPDIYRIKPPERRIETIRFKVGLFRHAPSFVFQKSGFFTETVESEREAELSEVSDSFVRWLTDWIGYEVEVTA